MLHVFAHGVCGGGGAGGGFLGLQFNVPSAARLSLIESGEHGIFNVRNNLNVCVVQHTKSRQEVHDESASALSRKKRIFTLS